MLFLLFSMANFGQEKDDLNLFETDSTWLKEIIKFPLGFAQEIKFKGFEDLRFPKGWANKDSPEFWSYLWGWRINEIEKLNEKDIETSIQFYFDGLMGINIRKANAEKMENTNALFIIEESSTNGSKFIGKVKTFDTRFQNAPMTLNVLVDQTYCKKQKRSILVFRFSPLPFDADVWTKLKTVELKHDACES